MANYCIWSDLQIPFEHPRALEFCKYLYRHFKCTEVLCVGDEVDNLHGGLYPKDPDALHSPIGELKAAREKLSEWFKTFPHVRVAISNHGNRWIKKASMAEIPSQLLRTYQEVLGIPETWRYADQWLIKEKHPFLMNHGMDLGGKTPYRQAAELSTVSRLFGHLHTSAGIAYVRTIEKFVWGFNVGCLIDRKAYAFKYASNQKFEATCGAGVILNEGALPIWIPID